MQQMDDGEKEEPSRSTLPRCLQHIKRGNIGVGVLPESDDATDPAFVTTNLASLLSGYENDEAQGGEGYAVMTNDRNRVRAFHSAICGAVQDGCTHWVEIGPGADGALTRLILNVATHTRVTAIEGNAIACKSVQKKLSLERSFDARWSLLHALTSQPSAAALLQQQAPTYQAILSEVLGLIMSAEYVVDIMADVHAAGLRGAVYLPRWGATFYTPVTLDARKHLRASLLQPQNHGVGVAVAPDAQWLHARRVPLYDAATFRRPDASPAVGCLECVDFAAPLAPQRLQQRSVRFSHPGGGELLAVDGVGMWIWVGFDRGTRRGNITRTAFPYGCAPCDNMPLPSDVRSDTSSYSGEPDHDAHSDNWRNVVMLFQPPLVVPCGATLVVHSTSDLTRPYQPVYAFHAEVVDEQGMRIDEATSRMDTPYHAYEFAQA
jgi:hypothetical protein